MQIELHIPSGRLLAVDQAWSRGTSFFIGRLGNGSIRTVNQWTCIPHSTMCGPFSRDPLIAAQCKMLGNATSRAGAAFWASEYMREKGIIKS